MIQNQLLDVFKYIIVISPTNELSNDFSFLKDQKKAQYKICNGQFETVVERLTHRLENLQRECNQSERPDLTISHETLTPLQTEAPPTLLVVDDCATDPILNRGSILDRYMIRHRHCKLSAIIVGHSLRGVCGLPKATRSQTDYNIIFNPSGMRELYDILRECLFPEDLKFALKRVRDIFDVKYAYLIYEPAAIYDQKLRDMHGNSLIRSNKKRDYEMDEEDDTMDLSESNKK